MSFFMEKWIKLFGIVFRTFYLLEFYCLLANNSKYCTFAFLSYLSLLRDTHSTYYMYMVCVKEYLVQNLKKTCTEDMAIWDDIVWLWQRRGLLREGVREETRKEGCEEKNR